MMAIFSEHFDELQHAILSTEYHEDLGKKCRCGDDSAVFRCPECFHSHLLCRTCILATHINIPFHYIQEWTGTYFKRTSLANLGGIVPLGHSGQSCPNRLPTPGRHIVVVHTNGIHHIHVQYCRCARANSEAMQLTCARLFPATMDAPQTVFTFDVLRDFHVHSLASKKSAMDHFTALQNHTNKAFPQKTPVRSLIHLLSHAYSEHRTM